MEQANSQFKIVRGSQKYGQGFNCAVVIGRRDHDVEAKQSASTFLAVEFGLEAREAFHPRESTSGMVGVYRTNHQTYRSCVRLPTFLVIWSFSSKGFAAEYLRQLELGDE